MRLLSILYKQKSRQAIRINYVGFEGLQEGLEIQNHSLFEFYHRRTLEQKTLWFFESCWISPSILV